MRMLALDFSSKNDPGIYYHEQCASCKHHFFFRTPSLLRSILDRVLFETEMAIHKAECVNNRIETILKGESQ